MHFKQCKHIEQERQGGKAAVRLATSVRVSCKRIRNTCKAIGILTTLEAGCLQPVGVRVLLDI